VSYTTDQERCEGCGTLLLASGECPAGELCWEPDADDETRNLRPRLRGRERR
jgi:hypothetical protein